MPVSITPKVHDQVLKIRQRADEADRRADLARECGANDTARHARRSAAFLRVQAEEVEGEVFTPVVVGE